MDLHSTAKVASSSPWYEGPVKGCFCLRCSAASNTKCFLLCCHSQQALSATEAGSFKQAKVFQVSCNPPAFLPTILFAIHSAALSSAPNGSHIVGWGFLGLGGWRWLGTLKTILETCVFCVLFLGAIVGWSHGSSAVDWCGLRHCIQL